MDSIHHFTGNFRKNKLQELNIPNKLLSKINQYFKTNLKQKSIVNSTNRIGRLINLAILCHKYKDSNSAFVECGVAKGKCLAIMKHFSKNKNHVWGFDSFEGLPKLTEKDEGSGRTYEGHSSSGGIENLYKHLNENGISIKDPQLHIIKGFFKDTFPKTEIENISILRIDADWYEPTMECLEKFYENVISGGVIIIDDYGAWKGCQNATKEFREKHNITEPLIETPGDWSEVYWIKR